MDHTIKEAIARRITSLVDELREVPAGKLSPRDIYFWNLPGRVMYLPSESKKVYVDVINTFRRHSSIGNRLSTRKLHSLLEDLLTVYVSGDRDQDRLEQLVDELEAKAGSLIRDWHFYLPIDGIIVTSKPLALGDHLLFRMDEMAYEGLVAAAKAIWDSRKKSPNGELSWQRITGHTLGDRDYFVNKPFLRVRMTGDADLVENKAQAECEPLLHILTFLLFGHRWSAQKFLLRFGTFQDRQKQIYPLVSVDEKTCRFGSGWPTNIERVTLDDPTVSHLQKLALDELVGVFVKSPSSRTEVERILLRSLRLFYNAYTSSDNVTEFLNYIMILECFLSEDRDPKKKIASGAAILIEYDSKRRSALELDLGSLYDLRTNIVHGKPDTVSPADLEEALFIAYKLISTVIQHKNTWSKRRDIRDYIRQKSRRQG